MPHIVKWKEKVQLVKIEPMTWGMDLERKYYNSPAAISSNKYTYNGRTLFNLIGDIIEDILPQAQDEFFNQFVDIKEVPYGRYNPNTDH